jgi:hypothetical protein
MSEHSDRLCDHAPHFEDCLVVQEDVAESWVFGLQPNPFTLFAVALDREFAAEQRQHNGTFDGRARAIDHRDIAREESDRYRQLNEFGVGSGVSAGYAKRS